eukprot:1100151-Amphidinium_carterae.2
MQVIIHEQQDWMRKTKLPCHQWFGQGDVMAQYLMIGAIDARTSIKMMLTVKDEEAGNLGRKIAHAYNFNNIGSKNDIIELLASCLILRCDTPWPLHGSDQILTFKLKRIKNRPRQDASCAVS